MADKKYIVANPRGIPAGTHIIGWHEVVSDRLRHQHFLFEGDEFVKPDYLDQEPIDQWIERGFLVEA